MSRGQRRTGLNSSAPPPYRSRLSLASIPPPYEDEELSPNSTGQETGQSTRRATLKERFCCCCKHKLKCAKVIICSILLLWLIAFSFLAILQRHDVMLIKEKPLEIDRRFLEQQKILNRYDEKHSYLHLSMAELEIKQNKIDKQVESLEEGRQTSNKYFNTSIFNLKKLLNEVSNEQRKQKQQLDDLSIQTAEEVDIIEREIVRLQETLGIKHSDLRSSIKAIEKKHNKTMKRLDALERKQSSLEQISEYTSHIPNECSIIIITMIKIFSFR